MYYSFIYPYLCYGIEAWGHAAQSHIQSLVKLQKKTVRVITFSGFNAHTAPIFVHLNFLPFSKIRISKIALFMFKQFKKMNPVCLENMFKINANVHSYSTRNVYKYYRPLVRTEMYKKSMIYCGVIIWNYFVDVVVGNCCYHTYKKRIKKFLLCNDIPIT